MKQFANDFHSWLRHSLKWLANRLTRDPKIIIHGNSCIILYFIDVLMMHSRITVSGTQHRNKGYHIAQIFNSQFNIAYVTLSTDETHSAYSEYMTTK